MEYLKKYYLWSFIGKLVIDLIHKEDKTNDA